MEFPCWLQVKLLRLSQRGPDELTKVRISAIYYQKHAYSVERGDKPRPYFRVCGAGQDRVGPRILDTDPDAGVVR